MDQIILRIHKAKLRDIGRNIIRIDSDVMKKLSIQHKDFIKLRGNKESASVAMLNDPSDEGSGIIRMDSRLRKNTGTIINDTIEVQKITPQPAQKVNLAPIYVELRKTSLLESIVKKELTNYPLIVDDLVFLSLGSGRDVTFKVIDLSPRGVCIVNQDTAVQISPTIKKFDFLSDVQLTNLEKFFKKCNYRKEDLVADIEQEMIVDDDWIGDPKVKTIHIIEYLLKENDLDWLISKIALDLYNKYEKTISIGQAEAVLKRVLDIRLSSTGRTQLYELRKKIRKYENFLANFSDLAKIYDFIFKVVIFGLKSEQATELLLMPSIPGGKGQRDTIGVGFYPKTIEISDKKVKLQLWDISSEIQWRSYIQSYCKGASGALLVYDKKDPDSIKLIKDFYSELKEATDLKFQQPEMKDTYIHMPIFLIGLGDGENVTTEEGKSLAMELNISSYIEISETDVEGFENVLSSLSRGIITNYQNPVKKYPYKLRFKIAVVGDTSAGTSSLISRYTKNIFKKEYVKTIGAQYSVFDKEIEGDLVRLLFWDIAGSKQFQFLHQNFFKNSRAAIIAYSLKENDQERDIITQISDWYEQIKKICGDIPILIIANKADLIDKNNMDFSNVQEFVDENNLLGYYLTSVKTGQGVKEAFEVIIDALYFEYSSMVK
ncbi:MAG: GTP-binding protein [Candidatus Hodarchaeales archaeon]|jgi:small GTP-binding protein